MNNVIERWYHVFHYVCSKLSVAGEDAFSINRISMESDVNTPSEKLSAPSFYKSSQLDVQLNVPSSIRYMN